MTTSSYPPFPSLATIAFRTNDSSEHTGGGHCAGLPSSSLPDQWDLVLSQHLAALEVLVDKADEGRDGWALMRPVLFAAHHVCEVALKTKWVQAAGTEPRFSHSLRAVWDDLATTGYLGHLAAGESGKVRAFLDFMGDLTPDGQTTRYPLQAGRDISSDWCCINSSDLRSGVHAFVSRLELI